MRACSMAGAAGLIREYHLMLAPLPRLYRFTVVALVLALCLGAGVIAAEAWSVPLPLGGLLAGTLVGLGLAFLLVHDFHHQPRAARAVRRR